MCASNVLLTVVIICVSCHALKTCLNIVELIISFRGKDLHDELKNSTTMNILSVVSNFLIIVNSSSNFFVYLVKDPKFLQAVRRNCLGSDVSNTNSNSSENRNETMLRSIRRSDSSRRSRRLLDVSSLRSSPSDCLSNTISSNVASSPIVRLSPRPLFAETKL